jgi:hypothetical protein
VVKAEAKKYLADAEDSLRLFDTIADTEMEIALAEKAHKSG